MVPIWQAVAGFSGQIAIWRSRPV